MNRIFRHFGFLLAFGAVLIVSSHVGHVDGDQKTATCSLCTTPSLEASSVAADFVPHLFVSDVVRIEKNISPEHYLLAVGSPRSPPLA